MTHTVVEKEVREALQLWLDAFETKDLDALCSRYDPEAVYANDGAPLMMGVGEIRPWFEQAFKMFQGDLLFKEEVLIAGSDMAVMSGKFCFRTEGEDDETGRVGLVFRKNEEGEWLLLFDMDNRPPDVLSEDF